MRLQLGPFLVFTALLSAPLAWSQAGSSLSPLRIAPGRRAKRSQMDSPFPSAKAAPSIWGAAAETPQTKFRGK